LLDPLQWTSLSSTPTVDEAQVNYGTNISLRDADPASWAVNINGTPTTVTNVGTNLGQAVTLALSDTIDSGDVIDVTYAPPPYDVSRDSDGAKATAQTGQHTVP